MSDTLFDPTPYTVPTEVLPTTEELAEQHAPLLETLGLTVNQPNQAHQYIAIHLKPESTVYEPGDAATELRTNSYADKYSEPDSWFNWRECGWDKATVFEGFLQGAFRLEGSNSLVLHIEADCTDVRTSSVAIKLEDAEQVAVYPQDPADLMAATQNAAWDGNSYEYQRIKGLPLDVVVTYEELEPYVTTYWPKPSVIFTAE